MTDLPAFRDFYRERSGYKWSEWYALPWFWVLMGVLEALADYADLIARRKDSA